MIMLSGYKLNNDQRVCDALRKIFGIGFNKSKQIVCLLGLTKNISFKDLDYSYQIKLDKIIVHYIHGFRAKRNLKTTISDLIENKSYRGVRHSYFLSVRGQRTHTNAKTQRNKKNKKIK